MDDVSSLRGLSTEQLIEKILEYKETLEREREDFDEFKQSSREMEDLLEQELSGAKKQLSTSQHRCQTLEMEHQRIEERHNKEKREMLKIEESLRSKVDALSIESEDQKQRIRELEQRNDDLERHERNSQHVLKDLEKKLNDAVERTTLLENEIADKQMSQEEMFRLKEELRERPKLVVGPMRIEKFACSEPSPVLEEKVVTTSVEHCSAPDTMTPEDPSTKLDVTQTEELLPTVGNGDGKGFAQCVNRIVKDLMVKVDRLENILTGLRPNTPSKTATPRLLLLK